MSSSNSNIRTLVAILAVSFSLSGCAVLAVADLAVGVVSTTVKGVGSVVGAVIPDGEDSDKKDD